MQFMHNHRGLNLKKKHLLDTWPPVHLYIRIHAIICFIQADGKAALYGTGRQRIGAIMYLVTYCVVGLSLGIPLMLLTPIGLAGNVSNWTHNHITPNR